ncbi:lysophospholipid acyltransferase family protein [Nocardioides massiliensis]|uniref:1-acyl-sn-glycerol-3-phosphate acyltransferase n=1 Tax=Nocardioides massiliensis TaxID=1325935 RepID=A0ABT9NN34_9ACTN|nr:lysophospholipid acyltransferase family protein [Nocardioides massiliensis]MDP9821657.1 1-acyl-sn-glycerol-3-phosphate acyltransferase [Nocardioides massiliensis]
MADAEIIPLGTRGRPGRGTGRDKPSSAARDLAPAAKAAPRKVPSKPVAQESPEDPAVEAAAAPEAGDPTPIDRETADQPAAESPADAASGPTEPHTPREVRDRPGIPVGDWLNALTLAAREVFGEDWERQLAEMLAFLRHRVTGDYEVDEYGFDQEIAERFFLAVLRPIAEKWFRIEVRGAENIPAEGGALVVSNHSGTIPIDGLMTGVAIHEHTGRHLRPLGADLVFRMPVIANLARKAGATLACNEDAERMLSGGKLVGVWPEGFKGIGKPYSERYKLQRFGRGGFVSAAVRTGVPIIPCSVVGAEEIYPLVGNIPSLARLLGVPYIPITPLFPWLGPLGLVPLPSKWLIEFGEPIRTDSYDEGAADDPMLVFNVTDQVRETIQQTLYSLLMQRRSVFR